MASCRSTARGCHPSELTNANFFKDGGALRPFVRRGRRCHVGATTGTISPRAAIRLSPTLSEMPSLNGGELQVIDGNKKVLDTYKLTAGKAMWLGADPPGQMHADVNPGKTPVEVIVVQLQQDTVKKK